MKPFFFTWLLLGLCLSFGLTSARCEPVLAAGGTEIGELIVQGQGDNESPEKPSAFASVIHPDEYSNQLTTLPELLSQQVGVHVQSFGGLGQLSTVSIRGSTAEQVSVFIDGIKINTAQGGAVDFSTLPLGSIERVEILRGGASSQFGSDAIGGVINIVTKRAQKKYSLELKYSEGSFFTIQTHEGFSKRFGKIGLVFDHTHLSSDGDFPFLSSGVQFAGGGQIGGGKEFTRLHNSFFSEGFLSSMQVDLSEKWRLNFLNDFFATSRDEPGTEFETTQLYPANPLNGHEVLFRDAAGVQLKGEDVFVKGLDFSVAPNYRMERSHFTDATPALGGPIDVTYLNQAAGIKPKWTYHRDFGAHAHDFALLYDFRYEHFSSASPLPGTALPGTHTRRTNALFFQDEINLLDGNLFFNPSVRYEHANDFGGDVALHFGIVGRPASWVALKSNVENSFRYPSFNELYFPDQGFLRGNPNLLKEEAINFDVGAVFQKGWAQGELSYFRKAEPSSGRTATSSPCRARTSATSKLSTRWDSRCPGPASTCPSGQKLKGENHETPRLPHHHPLRLRDPRRLWFQQCADQFRQRKQ
ncbi:MAG: TonB-dependent receptor [Deltaproteobacteria bacterium]|nr:TonB-dependent receptor [Deltaproteobacteria bacterium]